MGEKLVYLAQNTYFCAVKAVANHKKPQDYVKERIGQCLETQK